MSRSVPVIVLNLIEEWARDSIRNRPDKGWTGEEILVKVKKLKEKSGWGEFMAEKKGKVRPQETEERHPDDPTEAEIYEQAAKLRELRDIEDEHWARKTTGIRTYRKAGDFEYEKLG